MAIAEVKSCLAQVVVALLFVVSALSMVVIALFMLSDDFFVLNVEMFIVLGALREIKVALLKLCGSSFKIFFTLNSGSIANSE